MFTSIGIVRCLYFSNREILNVKFYLREPRNVDQQPRKQTESDSEKENNLCLFRSKFRALNSCTSLSLARFSEKLQTSNS